MKNPSWIDKLDYIFFGLIINLFYPQYYRPRYGYIKYYVLFFRCLIPQKIFRINGKVKWPVHFTSWLINPQNITKGIMCDPGDNLNTYIQANNGIHFGSNVELGPSVQIISSNHNLDNFLLHDSSDPIIIGNHVWIGGGSIILPAVNIGDNVIIGAGSVVTKNIPSNSIAVGNPCRVIKEKENMPQDISDLIFNKKIPEKYRAWLNNKK